MDNLPKEKMMRRDEAAAYVRETYNIPCSPKTLAKIACVGKTGPVFQKFGPYPMYPQSGLDEWVASKYGAPSRIAKDAEQIDICK